MKQLRIPAVLASTVIGVTAVLACDDHGKHPDASASCQVFCVYQSVDNGNCPFPTCATGSNMDGCPQGCIPEPIA